MFVANDIMKTNLITVNRKASIYEAIRTLVEKNITGLPVLNDDGTIAGIISEKDMLELLYNIDDKPGSVEKFMTEQVVTFKTTDSLTDIADCFNKNNFRRVLILKDEKLVGIISRKDIIQYILSIRQENKVNA